MAAVSRETPPVDTTCDGHTRGVAQTVKRMLRYRRYSGVVMWVLIGGAVAGVAILLATGAPPGSIQTVFGVLIVGCLLVCVGAAWAEGRTAREVDRAVEQLKARRVSQ